MKNILTGLAVLVFILCGWLLYEYKQIAGAAEAQVEEDVLWLRLAFEDTDTLAGKSLLNKNHLETKLMQQSVGDENKFIRHYRSMFIQEGEKFCLETKVSYFNHKPRIEQHIWLDPHSICTQ